MLVKKKQEKDSEMIEPPSCSTVRCNNFARFQYDDGWYSCLTCAKKDMEKGKLTNLQMKIVSEILATEMQIH